MRIVATKLWALCCVIVASWCAAVLQAPAHCSRTFSAGPINPSCAQHLRGAVGGRLIEPSATSFAYHCLCCLCRFFPACAFARECALCQARPLSPRCCLDSHPENLRTDRGPTLSSCTFPQLSQLNPNSGTPLMLRCSSVNVAYVLCAGLWWPSFLSALPSGAHRTYAVLYRFR